MASEDKKISSSCQVETEQVEFEWKICGFNKIPCISSETFDSPLFTIGDKSDGSWQMVMIKEERAPESSDSEDSIPNEKAIGFLLVKQDESSYWETVTYQVVIEYGGIEYKTGKLTSMNAYDVHSCKFFLASELGEEFFNQDEVNIKADLELTLVDLCPLIPSTDPTQFNKDLLALFESKELADITLNADGTEILGHRGILATKAYTFDCDFQDDPEYKRSKVEVDIDSTVVHALLIYVYCCGMPKDFPFKKFPELVKAAERFGMADLKELALKYLDNNLYAHVCPKCLKATKTESASEVFLRLPQAKVDELVEGKPCKHRKTE